VPGFKHVPDSSKSSNRRFYEVHYKVCMKLEEKVNGINISAEPYKNWNWTVIIHKMRNSNKSIREQAEFAFDTIYGKPYLS